MELNSILFPIPRPSYSVKGFRERLFYIPHKGDFRNHWYTKSKKLKLKPQFNSTVCDINKDIKVCYDENKDPEDLIKWVSHTFIDSSQTTDITQLAKDDNYTEEIEITGNSKVHVPSFSKQTSPFKQENKCNKKITENFNTNKAINVQPVDHKCMIIENFKGWSQSAYIKDHIPCLFLRNFRKTNKMVIYFHGNAEDLGGAYHFLKYFQFRIETHIINYLY